MSQTLQDIRTGIDKRRALGEIDNTIHNVQDAAGPIKNEVMRAPLGIPRKQPDGVRKPTGVNKENAAKKDKENAISKVKCRKPVRQESIVIPSTTINKPNTAINKPNTALNAKPSQLAIKKKSSDAVSKTTITEKTKDLTIYDPDDESRKDPQMVTDYIQDILTYVKSIEDDFPIAEKFLDNANVTPKMRSTLINWLVEAHQSFTMGQETLHLCVSIVDRYTMISKSVDRSVYQLVGAVGLLLAAKYEEIYIPDLDDFVYLCDNAFTKSNFHQMEIDMAKKLDFRLGWPLSIFFLRRYSKIAAVKSEQHTLAKYILELALLEYSLAHVKPSVQAAAACCLSIAVMNEVIDPQKIWTPTLVHYTKYRYSDFKHLLYEFAKMLVKAETSKFDSIRQKYSSTKHGKISVHFKLQGPLIRKLSTLTLVKK